ncbi:integrase, partial [Vibrio anguillarum]|nr:integrase [Vibrio anguillarum]
ENLSEYRRIIQLYANKRYQELDDVVMTKKSDGSPCSHFGDEEWDFSAYLDARVVHKKKIIFANFRDDSLVKEMKLICFSWVSAS